jgi:hypothetical protein
MGAIKKTAERRARPNASRIGRPPVRQGKLGLWIEKAGKTRQDVADQLGISRRFLDHLCREYRRPGLDLAVKIERLTGGAVPVSYLAGLPQHKKD